MPLFGTCPKCFWDIADHKNEPPSQSGICFDDSHSPVQSILLLIYLCDDTHFVDVILFIHLLFYLRMMICYMGVIYLGVLAMSIIGSAQGS
jgi:hypothetical protein